MLNGLCFRNRRPSSRRLAGVAALGVILQAAAGCQRLPLRFSEIEALATGAPTTVVQTSGAPSDSPASPSQPDPKPKPQADVDADTGTGAVTPAPSEPAPTKASTELETSVLGPTETLVAAEAIATKPADTPLLDAALARAQDATTTVDAPVEMPVVPPLTVEPVVEVLPAPTFAPAPPPVSKPNEEAAPRPEPKAEPKPEPKAESKPEPEVHAPRESKPKAIVVDQPIEPVAATPRRDDWDDLVHRLRELARTRAGAPGDAAEAWSIRARVLDWLAGDGDGDDPRQPIAPAWNRVLAALSMATSVETIDDAARAHHLGAAVETLEAFAPLQIRALALCRKIDGYGQYEPLGPADVHAGKPFLVYCELDGLRYEQDADGYRSRLVSRLEVLPAAGGQAIRTLAPEPVEDHCRRRRRDFYAHYFLRLPTGAYTLRLTQTDLVSGHSTASSLDFQVSP